MLPIEDEPLKKSWFCYRLGEFHVRFGRLGYFVVAKNKLAPDLPPATPNLVVRMLFYYVN